MKIDPLKFGIAGAAAAAIVWVICSVLVWLVPGGMMNVTTNMMHMEMGRGGWTISPVGVAWGLVGWSLFTGIFAWLLAAIYNRLLKNYET